MKKWPAIFASIPLIILAIVIIYLTIKSRDDQTSEADQSVRPDAIAGVWYKNSIIYTLDVEVFKDSDGDGVGDFRGLVSRLGYIDSLGADVLWLAPFQPTPNRDDGYDIANYYEVDSRLGTLRDFEAFMAEAKKLGLKVIMDLVVNHTSDEHPWFRAARQSDTSYYHSWYVWNDDRPKNYDKGMVFPGVQETIWSFDSVANKYYYHRFYRHQPDLNSQNSRVQKEVKKIIAFWMSRGIKGFRLDGVPFFIEVPDTKGEKFEHEYKMLADMRAYVNALDDQAIILGEANVLPDENKNFFGENGEGMHMMFNFFVNQHLFYALATGNVSPLIDALERTKEIPRDAGWGQFLRNHDEVDLGRLSDKEREEVYSAFGPDENMQLYDRGIRRRLAPMMNNDRKHLELAYSALLSLPSTPVLRYGDEIGMGDDLTLQERLSVRTPMQWDDAPNAGFTKSTEPVRPVISSGAFGYDSVNVKEEEVDSLSMLNWTKRMIMLRKNSPEIAFGSWEIVDVSSDKVLALLYRWNGKELLTLHNFGREPEAVHLTPSLFSDTSITDLRDGSVIRLTDNLEVELEEFGYRWFRIK